MNKKLILIALIIFSCFFYTGCNKIQKENKTVYPYHRWDDGFTRFYTDTMKEKYPEILRYSDFMTKNHLLSPFELKRNDDGLIGVWEKETDKQLIPYKYKYLQPCSGLYAMFLNARDGDVKKILSYNDDVVFEAQYDEFDCKTSYCGIKTENNGKFGMVSYDGIEVLKPEYDDIECQEHFAESGGWYYIARKGGLYGVVDNKGKKIISFRKNKITKNTTGAFFNVEENGKLGIIDIYGNIIVKPKYNSVKFTGNNYNYDDGYFIVCDKNCGTIDTKGRQILPMKFGHDIIRLNDKYFAAGEIQKGMKIIDKNGRQTSDKTFDLIRPLSDNYAFFRTYGENGGIGVIDFKGNIIMEPVFDVHDVEGASDNGLIKVRKFGKYGIVYKNKMILEPVYYKVYLKKGHVMVLNIENGEKYYYISSFEDFAKNEGNLEKCKKYHIFQYKKTNDDKCFKFIKDDKTEDIFCSQ